MNKVVIVLACIAGPCHTRRVQPVIVKSGFHPGVDPLTLLSSTITAHEAPAAFAPSSPGVLAHDHNFQQAPSAASWRSLATPRKNQPGGRISPTSMGSITSTVAESDFSPILQESEKQNRTMTLTLRKQSSRMEEQGGTTTPKKVKMDLEEMQSQLQEKVDSDNSAEHQSTTPSEQHGLLQGAVESEMGAKAHEQEEHKEPKWSKHANVFSAAYLAVASLFTWIAMRGKGPSTESTKGQSTSGASNTGAPDVSQKAQLRNMLRWWTPVIVLVLQNSGLILMMRYSRLNMSSSGPYLASSAVVCSEFLKLVGSFSMSLHTDSNWDVGKQMRLLRQEVVEKYGDMLKLTIPAFLYMIQNNLQYVATSNMSAPLCQVMYQMKLLSSAIFAVILLKRKLSLQQWMSMLVLTLGVGAVQYSQMATTAGIAAFNMVGVVAVLCACLTSGLAGAAMEMLLKTAKHSVWMRSVQFSLLGLITSCVASAKDASLIATNGFFGGFTPVVWSVVALQALGGLTVACVIKNADNLVKGFATSLAILMSCALSYFMFGDLVLHPLLFLGAGAVVGSTYWFGSAGAKAKFNGASK